MSNEEQVADKIEMLYERLNSYNKQDLFNYGYLLESNEILCKDIEEKDKEIERLNNIIKIKTDFINDLLLLIYYSEDNILHTKVHLTSEEYQDQLKELTGE